MSRIALTSGDVRMRDFRRQYVPILSTIAACLLSLLPIVVSSPIVPDFAFLVLIAWRLLRPEMWPSTTALAARPVQRSRRRPSARPVDGAVDDRLPDLRHGREPDRLHAITGWTGCSPALIDPRLHVRRLVYRPADGQQHGLFDVMMPQIGRLDPRLSRCRAVHARSGQMAADAMRAPQAPAADHREQPGLYLHPPGDGAGRRPGRASPPCSRGRMAYLSIAENERYKLLAESNRVQLVLVPPRRGWIVDRDGHADRDQPQRLSGRPDPRPAQGAGARSSPSSPSCSSCRPRRSSGSTRSSARRPATSRCRSPRICRSRNMRR